MVYSIYISKGCFYYLPTNNLLVGYYYVGLKKGNSANHHGELEPNRKLFPDHLPFILQGALVGAGSLWVNHIFNPLSSIPDEHDCWLESLKK